MQYPKCIVAAALLLLALPLLAQQAQSPAKTRPVVDNAFVQKEFGSTCELIAGPQPMIGDLDGDGVDDIALVAHCSNPLLDQTEDNFTLIDPYNAFFGYGDTRITSQFASEDPQSRGRVLLIIHGDGPDAWHADKAKAKFVVINLPFKNVRLRSLSVKKRTLLAIYAEETGADNMTSATYWDGKKYRYMPLGAGLE